MNARLDLFSRLQLVLIVQLLFLVFAILGNLFFLSAIFYWQKVKLKT
jgi:hypothetical protein